MPLRDVVLSHPVRTAIGTFNGTLNDTPASELGATVVRETLRRSGLDPARVGSVVMGNVIQAGNRMNSARQAAINGGVPVAVPAMTVNRVCGSGAQAIASAAQEIWLGHVDVAIAGGMENMDQAPYLMPSGRWGQRMGDVEIYDSMLRDGLNDAFSGEHSGWHTEDLVVRSKISREDQDRWAERSQKRFTAAQAAGRFAAEIVGVEVKGRKGPQVFDTDEANRPDTTLEVLAKLKPAFRNDGTITAGNAPGLNSGAAAMDVAVRSFADANVLEPLARLVSYGVAAVEPGIFGIGPVPAVRQALERACWNLSDVERVEINEAFAAVPLAVLRELGLPEDIVNVEGGAIAHGHPIGATGAVLTTRLLHSMRRDGLKRGVVTLCIGGGARYRACARDALTDHAPLTTIPMKTGRKDIMKTKIALVTGASSGIGEATAERLASADYKVYGTSRRGAQAGQRSFTMLPLDVTSDESVETAVAAVLRSEGRIDLLVNNAGFGVAPASAEESSIEQARAIFDTNFFGIVRMTRAVVPHMRHQGGGRIINIGSVLGFLPMPFMALYAATKHAIEGYSESLDHELRTRGIRVSVIEPAYTKTRFDANFLQPDSKLDEYREVRAAVGKRLKEVVVAGDEPEVVADVVLKAAIAARPKLRYAAGGLANRLRILRRFAPASLVDAGVRKDLQLDAQLALR